MKDQKDKISDIDLWNIVKESTKKLNSNLNIKPLQKNNLKTRELVVRQKSSEENLKLLKSNYKKQYYRPIQLIGEGDSIGVNERKIKNLRSGKNKIDLKLDLHGYKLKDAEIIFYNFIESSFLSNKRNLLIISGKGHNGEGKIKQSIPIWINDSKLSQMIYVYSYASPKDGGSGAFYICLRRKKQ